MISEIKVENSIQDSTQQFMDEIILSLNQEDKDNDVKLMTIHQSKGLEFKIVFLIGLNEGIIPPFKINNKTLEEERRLFYVAITRAKERLFLMSSKQRNINGTTRYYEPTRFIHEIEKQFIKII
jgi:DNA helicase-2/ATP-dependent DNA helicase PcrA